MNPFRRGAAVAALALVCGAGTLGTTDFFQDDRALVGDNPLLRRGSAGLPDLLRSGYWEAALGTAAPVQEYRPVLMLTFLAHFLTTGPSAPPMHAANLLLHALACALLWAVLRRRLGETESFAAALVFAVLPVHTEAVSALTGRSELLTAVFLLGAWLCLEASPPDGTGAPLFIEKGGLRPPGSGCEPRTTAARLGTGTTLFLLALLTKEHALLFPLILALSDWTFAGRLPWDPERRRVHARLAAALAGCLLLRWLLLPRLFHGGVDYFAGVPRMNALLTTARFAVEHYAAPALTGLGLCTDFSRPLIPDSGTGSPWAWACLLGLASFLGAAAAALRRRAPWAFWTLGPALFLLPTSHLLMPLDTLGAQRFLYIPSVGLCVGLGWLFARAAAARRRAAAVLGGGVLLWYASATVLRDREAWSSSLAYYSAAVRCNPVSVRSLAALGSAKLERGDAGGEADLRRAAELGPRAAAPLYGLARLAWADADRAIGRGSAASKVRQEAAERTETLARQTLRADPGALDAWVLLALALEARGRLDEAQAALEKALSLRPWQPLAEYNLGRLHLRRGRPDLAWEHFERFARLAPGDPDAPRAAALAASLRAGGQP